MAIINITPIPTPAPTDSRVVFYLRDITLTVAATPVLAATNGFYYCDAGDSVSVTAVVCDSLGAEQQQLSYIYPTGHPKAGQPMVLKLPLVRHAAGVPVAEEVYLNATFVEGDLTIQGKIPATGGDWKILIERCNQALQAINAPFKFEAENITFLA